MGRDSDSHINVLYQNTVARNKEERLQVVSWNPKPEQKSDAKGFGTSTRGRKQYHDQSTQ